MCLEYNKKEKHTSPNSKCLSLIFSKKAVNVFNFAQDEDYGLWFLSTMKMREILPVQEVGEIFG